jgi:release factor glutamine methyltransferase
MIRQSSRQLGREDALFRSLLARLSASWKGLPDKPEETPEATVRALWFLAAGERRSAVRAVEGELPPLDWEAAGMLRRLVAERMSGVPLAHLTGRQSFMGLELLAGPQALVPRQETEILGETALEELRALAGERGRISVLDLCTGSGNLAVALAARGPECTVYGCDFSPEAVELARRNAMWVGVADRVDFRVGDLFAPFEGAGALSAFDLIVCNPPYVSSAKVAAMPREVADYEPRRAFDGGPLGLSILLRLIGESPRYLRPSASLCFEVGAGQGAGIMRRLERSGAFGEIRPLSDVRGEVRVILARRCRAQRPN